MRFLYLPGASGSREFWAPVSELLASLGPSATLGWPGLAGLPRDPRVSAFDDLVPWVLSELTPDTHVIAQSMGTVVALKLAGLHPAALRSLVLVAPAGGIDVVRLGATDWRAGAPEWHPSDAPRYFIEERTDYTELIRTIPFPVLILSGDRDPLSPVAVGRRLTELLPNARSVVVPGGEHDLGKVHAARVAQEIRAHLAQHFEVGAAAAESAPASGESHPKRTL